MCYQCNGCANKSTIQEVADEAWSAHRKRNLSIIVSLFQVCCCFSNILHSPFLSCPLHLYPIQSNPTHYNPIQSNTMQGQLKSTVQCPQPSCKHISVTFDPFMFLSLPLPLLPEEKPLTVFFVCCFAWRSGFSCLTFLVSDDIGLYDLLVSSYFLLIVCRFLLIRHSR